MENAREATLSEIRELQEYQRQLTTMLTYLELLSIRAAVFFAISCWRIRSADYALKFVPTAATVEPQEDRCRSTRNSFRREDIGKMRSTTD